MVSIASNEGVIESIVPWRRPRPGIMDQYMMRQICKASLELRTLSKFFRRSRIRP